MRTIPDSKKLGLEIPEGMLSSRKIAFQLFFVVLLGCTVWIWSGLYASNLASTLYVLDVGQGDSQLLTLEGADSPPIKILIDGGRDKRVLNELDKALGRHNNKYIDIVILTHPDIDHLGGLVEVLQRYDVGLFISNGREGSSDAYTTLESVLAERDIPSIALRAGDSIQYGNNTLRILSPNQAQLDGKETNEASIVVKLHTDSATVLFTGDIGSPTENVLLHSADLSADILKVGHHGSKNSSSENFIATVRPRVSIIGVGKNSYGHPSPRVIETLELAGSRVYRTDENGTVKIPLDTSSPTPRETSGFLSALVSIATGAYKEESFTFVSLEDVGEEDLPFALVPHRTCTFRTNEVAQRSPIVFSEIAWMGASSGTTHEWIELRNSSGKAVNVSGWQIVNENERIHFTFPQQASIESIALLARSAANESLDLQAHYLFTGSLRNTNEGLRLFDNECQLIDEVFASPGWPAGDNKTKQTMERISDLGWRNSATAEGTPGTP